MQEWEACLPRLKAAYAAWHESKGGSIDTWLELVADEIDFRSLADGMKGLAFTANRSTRAQVRGYLEGLTAAFAMDYMHCERFVCQDDTIVAIGVTAWRHRRTGKRLATPKVDVWRFEQGRAVAFMELYDTARALEAATD